MKNLLWTTGLFALLCVTGCGGAEIAPESGSEEQEEAVSASALPGVAAIEFKTRDKVTTVGAASKVSTVMKAFKKPTQTTVTPACGFGPATQMTFYNAQGETIATGSMFCFRGTIKPTQGADIRITTKPGALNVLNEDPVPADALWAISKIEVERFGSDAGERTATKATDIKRILAAYNVDQKIDRDFAARRCAPTYALRFYRKNNTVAHSSFVCDAPARLPASLQASFTIPAAGESEEPLISGGITIDPRPVASLFDR